MARNKMNSERPDFRRFQVRFSFSHLHLDLSPFYLYTVSSLSLYIRCISRVSVGLLCWCSFLILAVFRRHRDSRKRGHSVVEEMNREPSFLSQYCTRRLSIDLSECRGGGRSGVSPFSQCVCVCITRSISSSVAAARNLSTLSKIV